MPPSPSPRPPRGSSHPTSAGTPHSLVDTHPPCLNRPSHRRSTTDGTDHRGTQRLTRGHARDPARAARPPHRPGRPGDQGDDAGGVAEPVRARHDRALRGHRRRQEDPRRADRPERRLPPDPDLRRARRIPLQDPAGLSADPARGTARHERRQRQRLDQGPPGELGVGAGGAGARRRGPPGPRGLPDQRARRPLVPPPPRGGSRRPAQVLPAAVPRRRRGGGGPGIDEQPVRPVRQPGRADRVDQWARRGRYQPGPGQLRPARPDRARHACADLGARDRGAGAEPAQRLPQPVRQRRRAGCPVGARPRDRRLARGRGPGGDGLRRRGRRRAGRVRRAGLRQLRERQRRLDAVARG